MRETAEEALSGAASEGGSVEAEAQLEGQEGELEAWVRRIASQKIDEKDVE